MRSFSSAVSDRMARTRSSKTGRWPLVVGLWPVFELKLRAELELRAAGQVPSPPAQVDSGNYHFAIACAHQRFDFANHFVQRQRAALSADVGNHAERAAVVAAVLHLQVGTSALVGGVEDRRGLEFGMGEDVGNEDRTSGVGPSDLGPQTSSCVMRDEVFRRLPDDQDREAEVRRPRSEVRLPPVPPADACASCRSPGLRRAGRRFLPERVARSSR